MRKLYIGACLVVFATACAHNDKKTDAPAPATSTKTMAQPTKTKASPAAGTVTCKNGADERLLEVKDQDGGCETLYTKAGEATSVATSNSGRKHCQDVAAKIQKHLADAGFSCQ